MQVFKYYKLSLTCWIYKNCLSHSQSGTSYGQYDHWIKGILTKLHEFYSVFWYITSNWGTEVNTYWIPIKQTLHT